MKKVITREEFIILTGARQTGKTSVLIMLKDFLEKEGQGCHYFNLENIEYLTPLNKHPFNIFELIPEVKSKQVIFIDEIQYLDNPTNFLKLLYDEKRDKVKIIASGSSAFYIDKKFEDSLAGRKFLFELYPLNFNEFLIFQGQEELLNQKGSTLSIFTKNKLIELWKKYLLYGGYPKVVLAENDEMRKILLEEIGSSYIKKDIVDAGVKNAEKYFALLRILAGQVGGLVNSQELSNTLKITHKTIDEYLYVIEKSYQAAFIKPFYGNIRKELIKMPKVYFYDLGLRNFYLNNYSEIDKRADKGEYLENIVFKEFLRIRERGKAIKYWRTQNKKEIDFIIGSNAYEIKFKREEIKRIKYKIFEQLYPDIKLRFLTYEDVIGQFYDWKIS